MTAAPLDLAAVEAAMRAGATDVSLVRPGLSRRKLGLLRSGWSIPRSNGPGSTMPTRPDTPLDLRIRANYDRGMTDYASAAALGLKRDRVVSWRRRWKMPPNGTIFGGDTKRPPIDVTRAAQLYASGLDDPRMAAALGVHKDTVRRWRTKNGLPGIGVGGFAARVQVQPAWRDPLWAACKRAVGDKLSSDIVDDAVSEMVVDVLEGRLSRDDIARCGRRYGTRAIQQWADRRGPLSLDEDRDGEGWTRYASLPCPGADEAFRVVELAHLAELRGIDWRAVIA